VNYRERVLVFAALAVLTLTGFFFFPGHTWLQSDTQIYIPIFEHLDDPTALTTDPVAVRPHVSWTIFDEIARGIHALTGLGYREILGSQQILFRFFGLLGVFLLAHSCGIGTPGALFVAAMFGLGAVVNGPSVLTLEYEPIPRGLALTLLMAAIGFGAKEHWNLAELFAALATLYHPPTTAPFWACALLWWLVRRDAFERLRLLVWALVAAVILLIFAMIQPGLTETQPLFGRIDPELEHLQRLRGSYNWIEMWPSAWFWQYPLLFGVVLAAWVRLKHTLSPKVKWFSLSLPVFGLLMVPISWLLLDKLKWILMPQYQPARAVLFITAFAVILSAIAGWRAAGEKRWPEAAGWFFIVVAIPLNGLVLELITSFYASPLTLKRLGLAAALAVSMAFIAFLAQRRHALAVTLAIVLPLIAIPTIGGTRNYPDLLDNPELTQLTIWASSNTPGDAVFLFADGGRDLSSGIFRVEAKRSIYADWKGGGQVNLLPKFAAEWWQRWSAVNQCKPPLMPMEQYRSLGIDYLVVKPSRVPHGTAAVFGNPRYAVIALR
jgi:hypothetical protein